MTEIRVATNPTLPIQAVGDCSGCRRPMLSRWRSGRWVEVFCGYPDCKRWLLGWSIEPEVAE